MERVAVFVDAGYVFAQGSFELCGAKFDPRRDGSRPQGRSDQAEDVRGSRVGLPLLRIYWYDGTSQGPTSQHITLAGQEDVKVRLGFVNSRGQQKGVDSLIVTDMITLARNRAMAECVLLSGDEDLRVGVQQAQEYGVRVHLLGIKPARGNQSMFLLQEADATHQWEASDLRTSCSAVPARNPINLQAAPYRQLPTCERSLMLQTRLKESHGRLPMRYPDRDRSTRRQYPCHEPAAAGR